MPWAAEGMDRLAYLPIEEQPLALDLANKMIKLDILESRRVFAFVRIWYSLLHEIHAR